MNYTMKTEKYRVFYCVFVHCLSTHLYCALQTEEIGYRLTIIHNPREPSMTLVPIETGRDWTQVLNYNKANHAVEIKTRCSGKS
jgi:hypothetical protein